MGNTAVCLFSTWGGVDIGIVDAGMWMLCSVISDISTFQHQKLCSALLVFLIFRNFRNG